MRKMAKLRKTLVSIVLLLCADLTSGKSATENRFDEVRGWDSILVTRCDIVCHGRNDSKCHRLCMKTPFEKHGFCPSTFANVPIFDQACVTFCDRDIDCPSTEKCCEHQCGSTCKPVDGLEGDAFLPEVPQRVTVSMRKGVHLSWSVPDAGSDGQLIMYVLEERHHLGAYFNEMLLGEWNPINSTPDTTITLKNLLKRGHFYQFRVASVNVNGTKGFSRVSEGFTLAGTPKLRKPNHLRIVRIKEENGTVCGTVRWKAPKWPIPIDKYKVMWSFKLDDVNFKYNSNSTKTLRATVPEDASSYRLKNLLKNKLYYIEVHAVASYGKETLKSEKAKMFFDTSKAVDHHEKRRKSING